VREDLALERLLQDGAAAARAGEIEIAREYFTQATERDPANVEAWLGLGGVMEGLDEKRACFERALALDPGNVEAQRALAWIHRKAEDVSRPSEGEARADTRNAAQGAVPCTYHPSVMTLLRCNRCGKPICPRCAVLTEVGYRCPDCVRNQQSLFFNIRLGDYPVAVFVAGTVAGLASLFLVQAGLFIALILSPVVGGMVGELVPRAIGRRRGRYMWLAVGGAIVVGGLLGAVVSWRLLGMANPLVLLIYLALSVATAVGRLR